MVECSYIKDSNLISPGKELYLTGEISENIYEKFLDILDTRNQLSHIYKEEFFKDILNKLADFLKTMKKIMSCLRSS